MSSGSYGSYETASRSASTHSHPTGSSGTSHHSHSTHSHPSSNTGSHTPVTHRSLSRLFSNTSVGEQSSWLLRRRAPREALSSTLTKMDCFSAFREYSSPSHESTPQKRRDRVPHLRFRSPERLCSGGRSGPCFSLSHRSPRRRWNHFTTMSVCSSQLLQNSFPKVRDVYQFGNRKHELDS